jgi:hypothetical protein
MVMERTHDFSTARRFLRPAAVAMATLAFAALSGCATNAWVKAGASSQQVSADATACRRAAYQAHPVYMAEQRDALNAPVAMSCAAMGVDHARAPCAVNRATRLDVRQRDLNERPRQQAFDRCLRDRGYVYTRVEG